MFSVRSLFARRLASALKNHRSYEKTKLGFQHLEDRINPAPLQFFYVPLPEAAVNSAFDTIITTTTVSTTQESIVSISVTENNTVIWYDQHEDGYENILGQPTQKSTQVWGDGNNANGVAPGFVNDPAGLTAGTVLRVRNTVNTPRNTTTQPFLFDSPDRFGSDHTVAVSRAQFPTTVGTGGGSVIASSVEVRDTRYFDTTFTSPLGTNTPNAGTMFSYSSLFAQAFLDNTRVQIDANNDGDFTDADDRDVILNQGQSIQSGQNVLQGARVVASKPVQVNLLTGQISGVYASRSYSLFSNAQSANDYFTPVGFDTNSPNNDDTDDEVRLYAYNPNSTAIQVRQESNTGIVTTKTIQPLTSTFFDVTTNSGTRLFSVGGEPFQAAGVRDALGTNHDWSFSLQPVSQLSEIALVGLGVGNSNTDPSTAANTSPVFVTVLGNTNLRVDYNGDGVVDQIIPMTRLQSIRLTDIVNNDGDNSAMRLFTDNGVLISVAWGQNGNSPNGSPGFDAGTTVPAVPVPEYYKSSESAPGGDVNGDGIFNQGDTIRYTLRIRHIGTQPISNAVITDVLPTQVRYIDNSATLTRSGATTPIIDSLTGTPFPFDGAGYTVATILENDLILVQFDAQINTGLPANSAFVLNTSLLSFDLFRLPANDSIKLRGAIGDRVYYDANGNGKDDGEPGINNILMELVFDKNGNGVIDTGEVVVQSKTTNNTGFYQFTDLDGGKYIVRVAAVNPNIAGYTLSDGINPLPVTLMSGDVFTKADFGYKGNSTIGDRVYIDLNGNGVQDAGEQGIVGASINVIGYGQDGILGNADDVAYTTITTGADGKWNLAGLAPGKYQVTASTPTGAGLVLTDSLDNGVLNSTNPVVITVAANQTINTVDFGYRGVGTIGDTVFLDLNGDGKQATDGSEPGIPGIPVTLTWAGLDGDLSTTADNQTYTIVTGKDGKYNFSNLPFGKYETKVDLAGTNLFNVSDLDGTADGKTIVTLDAGTPSLNTVDFGLKGQATVGDTVFYDVNANGKQDTFETGIGGAKVTLVAAGKDGILGNDDDVVLTTFTDGNGKYSFGNVPIFGTDDLVRVTVAPVSGFTVPTFDADGGLDNTSKITLGATATNLDQDFGYRGTRRDRRCRI